MFELLREVISVKCRQWEAELLCKIGFMAIAVRLMKEKFE